MIMHIVLGHPMQAHLDRHLLLHRKRAPDYVDKV